MQFAVGVVWFRNSADQTERWLAHVGRAGEIALRDGHLSAPLTIHAIDNSLPAGQSWAPVALPGGVGRYEAQASAGNIGFGAAHNRLMAAAFAAGADFYLCLNPDAMLHRRSLSEALAVASPAADALYEMRQFPSEHPKYYAPDTGETPWVTGCAILMPRKVHENIGGFDEAFFMYCEDVDLSWRVRLAGGRCLMVPSALVHHDIVGRKPDPVIEQRFLLSGYYLGTKWKLRRLTKFCQRRLARHKVPPPAPARESISAPRIATQAYRFSFSPMRWQI